VTEGQSMPPTGTAADALRDGALVLLEVRKRRKSRDADVVTPRKPWRTHDSSAAQRRGPPSALIEEIVQELLEAGVDYSIGIGPLVTRPNGTMTPAVYFVVAGSDEGGFFTLIAGASDRASAADLREALAARLLREGPPIMVSVFDDELKLAIWCGEVWPADPEAARLVELITSERRRG
jgi:hypothetical protein